jgi:hypothetical protein
MQWAVLRNQLLHFPFILHSKEKTKHLCPVDLRPTQKEVGQEKGREGV